MMTLPVAFYAEPRFRASSPDFERLKKLKKKTNLTLNTPGAYLALALDYYRVEAFATKADRNRACGPTAHEDVQYFPVNRDVLLRYDTHVEMISCGHRVGDLRFEEVFAPIFAAVVHQLRQEIVHGRRRKANVLARAEISIARACYAISIIRADQWLTFDIDGLSLFENIEQTTMDRTIAFLNERLALELYPARSHVTAH